MRLDDSGPRVPMTVKQAALRTAKWLTLGIGAAAIICGIWVVRVDNAATVGQANAQHRYETEGPDVLNCRAVGGFPIFSGWDGRMVECRPLVKK